MLAYEHNGFTVHAWTELHGHQRRGLATITGRGVDGRMVASTSLCPLLCGTDEACVARMRQDINAAIDRGSIPGSGSG